MITMAVKLANLIENQNSNLQMISQLGSDTKKGHGELPNVHIRRHTQI